MNAQIIGIDLANEKSEDCSAINSICGKCMSVIESKFFSNNDNKPQLTIFKKCPICGAEFKKHIVSE